LLDRELIDAQGRLKLENVKRSRYPELNMNGKATYQSDVISFQLDQPGFTLDFPEMPNEQFGINLDLSQVIFDGGHSKSRRAYELASTAAALQQVQVDLHALKQQVTGIYFSTLMLQATRKNLSVALENLSARQKVLRSAVENGVAEEADLKVIQVEMMKTLQTISELDARRKGAVRALSVYMGQEIEETAFLEKPLLEMAGSDSLYRPELVYFQRSSELLEAGKKLQQVKRMPRLYAFGQAGVGMPGYNMLNDQVDSYYMVGAGVQWKIWDWNTVNREQQILSAQQQVVEHAKESFSIQVRAGIENELAQMAHYRNAMVLDDKMLQMRMEITAAAASKVDNGVISATEYLQVLNEEQLARIARTGHHIRMLQCMANVHLLKGTL
jgi:outer membrane protein TolC